MYFYPKPLPAPFKYLQNPYLYIGKTYSLRFHSIPGTWLMSVKFAKLNRTTHIACSVLVGKHEEIRCAVQDEIKVTIAFAWRLGKNTKSSVSVFEQYWRLVKASLDEYQSVRVRQNRLQPNTETSRVF